MLAALLTAALHTAPAATITPAPEELWETWPEERVVTTAAPCLGHGELVERLEALAERHPGKVEVEEVGRSFEDRSIHLLTVGEGERKVMLWSQMHGDEPSATPALLDLVSYLLADPDAEPARTILAELTLLVVPMLNPDGSEIYERRNAQWIDVNRDALNLATPEGRLLKRLRDEHEPMLGFNLHDQNRRTAVGETGRLATNAVLAVAGDPENTLTPGRARAKRACAAIVSALAPMVPGGMARYDEDWSPRAFGDNLTAWGTPVVLIESGAPPPGGSFEDLTRLNFVALVTALAELARNDLADHDPQLYEDLERNRRGVWADVVVRGGSVLQPKGPRSYRADVAFDRLLGDRARAGCDDRERGASRIVEVGDARFLSAARDVDAVDALVVSPLTVGVDGWRARQWLSPSALSAFARWGVGEVRWSVPRRRLTAAREWAAAWRRPGTARVEVMARDATRPTLRAEGPPPVDAPATLGETLRLFGGSPDASALAAAGATVLRPGAPASLMILNPWDPSAANVTSTRLVAVWLDGIEVER